jgi:hypothetical protein
MRHVQYVGVQRSNSSLTCVAVVCEACPRPAPAGRPRYRLCRAWQEPPLPPPILVSARHHQCQVRVTNTHACCHWPPRIDTFARASIHSSNLVGSIRKSRPSDSLKLRRRLTFIHCASKARCCQRRVERCTCNTHRHTCVLLVCLIKMLSSVSMRKLSCALRLEPFFEINFLDVASSGSSTSLSNSNTAGFNVLPAVVIILA